jgi:hypothetical protein
VANTDCTIDNRIPAGRGGFHFTSGPGTLNLLHYSILFPPVCTQSISQYTAACSCHSRPPSQPVVSNSDAALTRKVDCLELLFLPLLYMTIQPCVKPLFLSGTRIRQKACFFLYFRNVRVKLRLRGSLGIFFTNCRQGSAWTDLTSLSSCSSSHYAT